MSLSRRPFCEFPFSTVELRVAGHFAPCCKWRGDLRDGERRFDVHQDTPLEVFRSTEMNRIRDHFLARDEFLPECSECQLAEKAGVRSTRQIGRDLPIANSGEEFPTRFEVKLGNFCNLACRICDPPSSINWVRELSEQGLIKASDFDSCKSGKIWAAPGSQEQMKVMLPYIREMHFTGGEPLIEKEHLEILEMAVEAGAESNIKLYYNTNGTVFNEKLFSVWQNFRSVELNLSIDDVGSRYEYERFGGRWDKVHANLASYNERTQTTSNLKILVWLTVSVFNVYYLDEILLELDQIAPGIRVELSLLYLPHHYSVKVLPTTLKEKIARKLRANPRFDAILRYMMDDDWSHLLTKTKATIARDDRFRKQLFASVFPEVSEFF